ncbi:MAG: type II toxin-antitoxin system VapC family toxin [Fimbriimonadales bacterium]
MVRIYLDTNVIIYLVENTPSALQVTAYLQAQSAPALCSSNLALMECLIKPLKQGNLSLRDRFLTFFQSLQITPARRKVFLHAAQIRATTGLRTPDALHLAFASCSDCDIFLTGDAQIRQRWQQLAGQYHYPSSIVVI